MKTSIFEYRDYKTYLVDLIENDESRGRGKRKELANFIGAQVSHITNVFSGEGHFTQEQAEGAARFFGLNHHESEFLLLLVQYSRAGTSSLKKIYEKILQERGQKYSTLKSRLKMPDSIKVEQEARYYSSWHFGAIHVLVSIPEFQTREAIAKKLELPISKVDQILSFLLDAGICKKEGSRYSVARTLLHLDKSSALISKHHTNWRLKSMLSFDENLDESIHYSSVFSLTEDDFDRVAEILKKSLSDSMKIITSSKEESAAVLCFDFFKL